VYVHCRSFGSLAFSVIAYLAWEVCQHLLYLNGRKSLGVGFPGRRVIDLLHDPCFRNLQLHARFSLRHFRCLLALTLLVRIGD